MPLRRPRSVAGDPASSSLRIPTFCASLKRDFFMVFPWASRPRSHRFDWGNFTPLCHVHECLYRHRRKERRYDPLDFREFGRHDDAALRISLENMAHRSINRSRVARIDRETRRRVRVAPTRVGTRRARVRRLGDPIVRVNVAPNVGLLATGADDLGIRGRNRERADGLGRVTQLTIADVDLLVAVVGAAPDAALNAAEVKPIRIARSAPDGHDASPQGTARYSAIRACSPLFVTGSFRRRPQPPTATPTRRSGPTVVFMQNTALSKIGGSLPSFDPHVAFARERLCAAPPTGCAS